MHNFYLKLFYIIRIVTLLFFISIPVLGQTTAEQTKFYETFSGNSFPAGWLTSTADNNYSWKVVQGTNAIETEPQGSALAMRKIISKDETNQNVWAYTSKMQLSANITYSLTFMEQNLAAGSASLNLAVGLVQDYKRSVVIASHTLGPKSGWVTHKYIFKVGQDGEYYISFGLTQLLDDLNIYIDEVKVKTAGTTKEFYNKSGADLSLLTSWGMDSDGNGLQPVNFSDPDQRFYIMNYAANTAPKLSKDLAVSGLESRVVLGNGLTAVNLTLVTGKSIIRGVIDVANNATLTINVPVFPALGNLSINSTVVLSKNAPTDLTQGVTFGNLILNSDKKNRLTKKITVKGKLDLIGGKLDLSDADLELDYGASVINATAVNYVEISSKGRLRQGIRAGAAEALLPVGRATYNPVKIKLAAGSQNDFFSVSILEKVYALYTNDVPDLKTPILSDAVNKTWLVSEDVKGGSNISLSLSWSLTDVLTGFNPANCHIKHYENGAWDNYTAGTAILSGTTYSVTRTDITTFSPFTASSASSGSTEANWGPLTLLPVELLYFAVKETDKNVVKLNWATVSEKDNDFFEVERSADGKNFVSIAKIKGAGNTNSRADYSFTDNNPLTATSYYRLRQVDLDESFEYSPVRSVSLKAWRSLVISFYPNPAQGSSVSLQLQGLNQGEDASLLITDMMGRSALQQQLQPGVVNIIPTVGLPSGTYLVNVAGREGTQTQKLIIR